MKRLRRVSTSFTAPQSRARTTVLAAGVAAGLAASLLTAGRPENRLRVTYDPRDPGRVRWDGSGPHLVLDTILALLGPVLLLLLFVVPWIRDRRRRAGRPPPATEG